MTDSDRQNAAIDREELEELVSEWRSNARQYGSHQRDTFNARCETYATCAEALIEVIGDAE